MTREQVRDKLKKKTEEKQALLKDELMEIKHSVGRKRVT